MQLIRLTVAQGFYRLECIGNISGRTVHVGSHRTHPQVRILAAPVAGRKEYFTARSLEGNGHFLIGHAHVFTLWFIAVVVFQQIDSDRSEISGILKLMHEAARISGTGKVAVAGVHAEF